MTNDRESGEGRSAARAPVPSGDHHDWLTLGQAARYLGMAQSTIRKWSDVGRLPAFYTPGGHRRYRRFDLDQFLREGGTGAFTVSPPPRRPELRRSILIVDDDDRLREFVRVNLEMEGYAVREASSAAEGLEALDDEPPDLILLDVMMPEVDGWEMLRRVQERHGVGAIPVIMFSGKVDEDSLKRATSRGAQGFIGKPFDPQQLIESTKQLVPT
jgi:excisionase family DNA binding protein